MAKKSLGYVELEWTCPSCNTRNPGSARKCLQCGTAQGEDIKFEQAPEEQILTDETKIAAAQAGPDIYCAYCGTRNPATAERCKQCGAPLGEGKARAAGEVLGGLRAEKAAPVQCPSCGSDNPATAVKCANCGAPLAKAAPPPPAAKPAGCSPVLLILLGLALLAVLFLVISRGGRDGGDVPPAVMLSGQVSDYSWRRVIATEALVPITREGWRDALPSGAELLQCSQRVYKTVDDPVPGAREVCGTPYVVDKGSGFGEVMQECRYEILADYCQYRTLAWSTGPPLVLEGHDLNPRWPDTTQLTQDQRAGRRSEEYTIVFQANDRTYTYRTSNAEEYRTLVEGAAWNLDINRNGQITRISAP